MNRDRTFYQVLTQGCTPGENTKWSLPVKDSPGDWMNIPEALASLSGDPAQRWRGNASLFLAEWEPGEANEKLVRARLIRKIKSDELTGLRIFTSGTHTVKDGICAASGDATVEASGTAVVYAFGKSKINSRGRSSVFATDKASVIAFDNSSVEARGECTVDAYDLTNVKAYERARIKAHDRSVTEAFATASVFAFDTAEVTGWDGATIRGYKSCKITGHGTCKVYTFDTAHARLHDRVEVFADGTSLIFAAPTVTVKLLNTGVVLRALVAA